MRFFLFVSLLGLSLTGCNVFSAMDKPSTDAQILEAARDCMDIGDYACSLSYYNQLSTEAGDTKYSETGLEALAQSGITVPAFVNIIMNGVSSGGQVITVLSNTIGNKASETTRLNLFHAYQSSTKISESHARGLMGLLTSLVLISEILQEGAATPGNLRQADLVQNPTPCKNSNLSGGGDELTLFVNCAAPTGSKISSGAAVPALSVATDASLSGSPTLYMIQAAVAAITSSLTSTGTESDFGTAFLSFSNTLGSQFNSYGITQGADSVAFRYILVSNGVGGAK